MPMYSIAVSDAVLSLASCFSAAGVWCLRSGLRVGVSAVPPVVAFCIIALASFLGIVRFGCGMDDAAGSTTNKDEAPMFIKLHRFVSGAGAAVSFPLLGCHFAQLILPELAWVKAFQTDSDKYSCGLSFALVLTYCMMRKSEVHGTVLSAAGLIVVSLFAFSSVAYENDAAAEAAMCSLAGAGLVISTTAVGSDLHERVGGLRQVDLFHYMLANAVILLGMAVVGASARRPLRAMEVLAAMMTATMEQGAALASR
eukprot:CAMPEP_0204275778 /NCGR_PEP_ID=MMETSP0468-20130131/26698_1 /ASSEMBLY_ACC=CAM_ASM_000383 /TAXON_ID=2969 /ORGANISM="Oxyrrhis marina" /LENGTH=254 /DNA_ID=CAMNT_0051252211 /DNA_START=25 /DNA_END=789 /DNA_ORIENTATION=-